MMSWYAVNTKPHQENKTEQNLRRLNLETFCPKLKQTKMIRRIRQTVIVPLFPGYCFVKLDVSEHYRAVNYARGVRKIVAFGSTPAVVDEGLIEAMKTRLENGYVIVASRSLVAGQVVRIHDGPLCGLEAVFEREMSDHQRAVLLLRTLAYQARVVVPFEHLANS